MIRTHQSPIETKMKPIPDRLFKFFGGGPITEGCDVCKVGMHLRLSYCSRIMLAVICCVPGISIAHISHDESLSFVVLASLMVTVVT